MPTQAKKSSIGSQIRGPADPVYAFSKGEIGWSYGCQAPNESVVAVNVFAITSDIYRGGSLSPEPPVN
jgi:hypothetical protein